MTGQKFGWSNNGWATFWPANFFLILAGPFFDWAKNGCGWLSQMGLAPKLLDWCRSKQVKSVPVPV
jgi:hypothetical protein